MKTKLLVDGGDMKPGPALSQQLGPLGVNMGKVISDINEATKEFKGIKVPVELEIDSEKQTHIKVFGPPTSQLIKKQLNIEKASGFHKKLKVGNLGIEEVIFIAKTKMPDMLTLNFKSAVKEVIGSCLSLGVLVENKEPKQIIEDIENGKFDKEIEQQKTDLSEDKKIKLKQYFDNLHKKQEAQIKKEEAEKAAEEAAKAEAAAKGEGEAKETESTPSAEGQKTAGAQEKPTAKKPSEKK